MPRVNTTEGEYYTGVGDMISLAWVAEPTRDTEHAVSFYAKGTNYSILKLLGQNVSNEPTGEEVVISNAYQKEMKEGGARLRLEYMREALRLPAAPGLGTSYRRPHARIPSGDLDWANEVKQKFGGNDLVLLFPQTFWKARAWPACYWVDLAWRLTNRNVSSIIMLADKDEQFAITPCFFWGLEFTKVAALMSLARLVVGNDSGPIHLSGTLGVRSLVTAGPTRSSCVFGHIPEVIALTNDEPPNCTGCHFQPPFRAACDQGCQALYALKPHVVLGRVISELALLSSDLRRGRRDHISSAAPMESFGVKETSTSNENIVAQDAGAARITTHDPVVNRDPVASCAPE
jgi:hypothetical protein